MRKGRSVVAAAGRQPNTSQPGRRSTAAPRRRAGPSPPAAGPHRARRWRCCAGASVCRWIASTAGGSSSCWLFGVHPAAECKHRCKRRCLPASSSPATPLAITTVSLPGGRTRAHGQFGNGAAGSHTAPGGGGDTHRQQSSSGLVIHHHRQVGVVHRAELGERRFVAIVGCTGGPAAAERGALAIDTRPGL